MKQTYTVLVAYRVGARQRWLMPGDTPKLLPCEAEYPLRMGWLQLNNEPAVDAAITKEHTDAAE